jgi:hypothetical protein
MNKRLESMERNHQEALALIEQCRHNADEPEMRAITEHLLDTDANPYSFLPEGWAGHMETSTGFASLLRTIHHAIYDDGDISFPIVNSEPRIAFVWRHEENYTDYVLSEQEKDLRKRWNSEYKVEQCKDVMEFIKMHREYHRNDVQRCFIQDAARQGWEFAVEHYSRYAKFDPDWEFDEEVVSKVEKIRKTMGFTK